MEKQQSSKMFVAFLICSVILVISLFWTYISAVILALLISSVSYPLYGVVKRLLRGHDHLAALAMSLFILLVLIIPFGWFVGTLSQEAYDFYERTRDAEYISQIQAFLESDSTSAVTLKRWGKMAGIDLDPGAIEKLSGSIGKHVGLFLFNQLSKMASNLLSFLIHFFLMLLMIFYLFRDGSLLKEYLLELIPIPREQLEKVAGKFNEMGRAIILGNGLSGIIQGILGGFGFFIFGLKAPFLWGTVLAFMAFLPIIGASVVFVPATAFLLIQGSSGLALGYLAYNMVYSSFIEYLAKPRLIGQGMHMNSLLVFVGIIGGIKLFGILGIIYGPLIITVFITLAEIYRLEYRPKPA